MKFPKEIRLTVLNWKDYNPRSDVKTPSWFRLDKDFFDNSNFEGMTAEEMLAAIYIFSQACKDNDGGKALLERKHMKKRARFLPDSLMSALEKLQDEDGPVIKVHEILWESTDVPTRDDTDQGVTPEPDHVPTRNVSDENVTARDGTCPSVPYETGRDEENIKINSASAFCGNVENHPVVCDDLRQELQSAFPADAERVLKILATVSEEVQKSWVSQFTAMVVAEQAVACANYFKPEDPPPEFWQQKIAVFLQNFLNRGKACGGKPKAGAPADDLMLEASDQAAMIWTALSHGMNYQSARKYLGEYVWWFIENRFGKWADLVRKFQYDKLPEVGTKNHWRDVMYKHMRDEAKKNQQEGVNAVNQ